jgi:type I restriction-modification system DNA methylase subunit
MPTAFETYISKIESDLRGGKATEHTYRSSLELLMESVERGIVASNDPKHIECGAPDFIIEKRKVPLGYVETKIVGENLGRIEKTDQMKRYLKALNNLILTDYLEFRWYVNGEKKRRVRVAEIGRNDRLIVDPKAEENLIQFFRDFYATETPTVSNPKELAIRLSGVTHFIREQIIAVLKSGDPALQSALQKRYSAFKDLLLPALKQEEFADLYAQTMTYGLFAAKLSAPEDAEFTLAGAYQFLFGNKFLRRLFSDVSEELDEIEIIRPYLLDIVSLLNRADFHSILADFGKRTRTEDPVVHFYETFLAAYDSKLRQSRGVYYTPEPVVQFIVNSVDHLLKTRFDRPWGLADSSVKVLDPATGTGTFLYYVIQKIHEEVVVNRKQAGLWKEQSRELLNRIFGFELLIAPYVVSHLKLGLLFKTLDAPLEGKDERLQVYLTNTLEEGVTRAEQLAGLGHYIAEEASDAAHVKKMQDIMVVLGNPPYSNFGMMNKSEWILELLEDYKRDLKEKKINLDDDYIKFIRFGQWRINKTGRGILALITNNSFIDGLTHRQMRKSLLDSFTEIYILDLHGSSKKQEVAPDGSKDENVFDIQQGRGSYFGDQDRGGRMRRPYKRQFTTPTCGAARRENTPPCNKAI